MVVKERTLSRTLSYVVHRPQGICLVGLWDRMQRKGRNGTIDVHVYYVSRIAGRNSITGEPRAHGQDREATIQLSIVVKPFVVCIYLGGGNIIQLATCTYYNMDPRPTKRSICGVYVSDINPPPTPSI